MRLKILLVVFMSVLGVSAFAQSRDPYNRQVVLINESESYEDVYAFYASNVGTNSWQEDILGLRTLAPGRRITINIDDGTGYCMYDFKAIMECGEVIIRRRVNVCEVVSWTIYH